MFPTIVVHAVFAIQALFPSLKPTSSLTNSYHYFCSPPQMAYLYVTDLPQTPVLYLESVHAWFQLVRTASEEVETLQSSLHCLPNSHRFPCYVVQVTKFAAASVFSAQDAFLSQFEHWHSSLHGIYSTEASWQLIRNDFPTSLLERRRIFCHFILGKTSFITGKRQVGSAVRSPKTMMRNFPHDRHRSRTLYLAFESYTFRVLSGTRVPTFTA